MIVPFISVEDWSFDEFFDRLVKADDDLQLYPCIAAGRDLISQAHLDLHPFFQFATENEFALKVWTMQECVITNHFSQVLFYLLSEIRNVHLRAILTPVVMGEHSPVRNGIAYGSHPHLLSKLCKDLGIDTKAIKPAPFTLEFANLLTECTTSLLYAFGVLGVGNEALLIPEYTAVERAFSRHFEPKIYKAFLRANIEEDKSHSNLFEIATICLLNSENDQQVYIKGAYDGVFGRVKYYDSLLDHCRQATKG